jgi:asparagine N-glycosylation enzyme membrane subunit Stt3
VVDQVGDHGAAVAIAGLVGLAGGFLLAAYALVARSDVVLLFALLLLVLSTGAWAMFAYRTERAHGSGVVASVAGSIHRAASYAFSLLPF